jgi:hypothetical protein
VSQFLRLYEVDHRRGLIVGFEVLAEVVWKVALI